MRKVCDNCDGLGGLYVENHRSITRRSWWAKCIPCGGDGYFDNTTELEYLADLVKECGNVSVPNELPSL